MKLRAMGKRYTAANKIRDVADVKFDSGWHRFIQLPHKEGLTIIPTEQLWGELLAYAGMPPPDDHEHNMKWIQDVLYALSEMYPDSSSRSRLDTMVSFSDYCKEEKRK